MNSRRGVMTIKSESQEDSLMTYEERLVASLPIETRVTIDLLALFLP